VDYQALVDTFSVACAVLSVQIEPDDSYGEIRIVCSNQPYRETMGPAYYDNMLYHELVPQDSKFEDFCYRAAVLGKRMHAYVETKALNCWTDQQMIPLKSDEDNMGYCMFLFEFTQTADSSRMANVSIEASEAVIRATLTMLSADDFIAGLKEVQRDFLRISEGFSCRIMVIDHARKHAYTLCEEFSEDVDYSNAPGDGTIPYEIVDSWEAMIGVSNAVIVKNERDMSSLERRNPAWVATMRQYEVKSLVLIPLREHDEVIGYLYITNFNVDKIVQVKELSELLAYILGSRVSNYLLMKRLEDMSNLDGLTGLLNRHAMSRRIKEISEGEAHKPFGVINIDLNGLKPVNDNEGHDAGDRLLVEAGEILQKVFHREDLFRTGGDEFIVIATDITQDVFERKEERLRADAEKNSRVSFAIGSFWSDGYTDVRTAFVTADERMYADKRAYYDEHPEKKRR